MKKLITTWYLPLLVTVGLAGTAPPGAASPVAPDPDAARFAELAPWIPECLPTVGDVLAFEEHKQFAYLKARAAPSATAPSVDSRASGRSSA